MVHAKLRERCTPVHEIFYFDVMICIRKCLQDSCVRLCTEAFLMSDFSQVTNQGGPGEFVRHEDDGYHVYGDHRHLCNLCAFMTTFLEESARQEKD